MVKNLNIIIITKNIHPQLSPRAFRSTELAKELARQGHNVTLYAVLGSYDYSEFERDTEVKVKNVKMFLPVQKSDGVHKLGLLSRIFIKLFKYSLEFPDIELMFKTANIIKKSDNIDLLITIAKPFTIHWGAALSKTIYQNRFPKTWIADCGDPYMGSAFTSPPFYFKYVEKWFSKKADYLTVPIYEAKEGYYKEFHNKIKIIPQGFKFDKPIIPTKPPINKIPTFIYAGTFIKNGRDPGLFLEYLATIKQDFLFVIYTKNKKFITPFLPVLKNRVILKDYIPRIELLEEMKQADFLLNFDNGTARQSPSKLIDYAIVNRPVLNIQGHHIHKNKILEFLSGDYTHQLKIENIDQYRIENVTRKFIKLHQEKESI